MGSPTRGGWKLLPTVEDFGHPLSTAPTIPYAALVACKDFGELTRDDLSRLCTQLALSGCSLVSFHGAMSDLAEELFDWALVYLGVALDGDPEFGRTVFADDWAGPVEESPAARWRTYKMFQSVSTIEGKHEYEEGEIDDSLSGSIQMMPIWTSPPPELFIALPLDDESGNALRAALDAVDVAWSDCG